MTVLDPLRLIDDRVEAIRMYHRTAGRERAQLDLSGGVDSGVMAGLLAIALGPENVIVVHSRIHTSGPQSDRAERLAVALGIPLGSGDFTDVFDRVVAEIRSSLSTSGFEDDEIQKRIDTDPTILGSIRSTLRAPIGRAYNRLTGGGIRHGTGNECEDRFLRFFQKGGDGEVDTNPLGILTKTEVFQLAHALGDRLDTARDIYGELIETTPSPDLWGAEEHHDEVELLTWTGAPFTYGRVDAQTGSVARFGSIERVARLLDAPLRADAVESTATVESMLFGEPVLDSVQLDHALARSREERIFPRDLYTDAEVKALLMAARRIERVTAHKANPNIPMLGTRSGLVSAGVLDDAFEEVAHEGGRSSADRGSTERLL